MWCVGLPWPPGAHQATPSLLLLSRTAEPKKKKYLLIPLPGKQDLHTRSNCFRRQMPSTFLFFPAFIAEYNIVWYGISHWSVWNICSGCGSPHPLVHSESSGPRLETQPWCSAVAAEQLSKHWCAINIILAAIKSTVLYGLLWGKLTPSQTGAIQQLSYIVLAT